MIDRFWKLLVILCVAYDFGSSLEQSALILSDKAVQNEDGVSVENEIDDSGLSKDVFIPTNEWQTIKPGQAIPRGLHVRLNLATGEKEAKLDNVNDGNIKYWETGDGKRGMLNADGSKTFTKSQLKEALKKFESGADEIIEDDPAAESVPDRFRSYDELKKDLEQLRVQIKSDSEIMTELLTEYKKPDTTNERKLTMLADLEYLVHQETKIIALFPIDNAQNFVDMNGLTIITQALNSTVPEFRELAAFIVGSATQSNPKVQIAVLESGILHHLIRVFQSEQSSAVRRKYLFAFSSILRHFPYAQKKFLDLGGFEVLSNVLAEKSADQKHKLKIITLLSDLLYERQDIERRISTPGNPSPIQHQSQLLTKLKQYKEAPLLDVMAENGWCRLVADLLSVPELDNQEKVLRAMEIMVADCTADFVDYKSQLRKMAESYTTQLDEEKENEFIHDLVKLAESVLSQLRTGKDEL